MCVDMDSFYASVEVRDNPELKGLPVAVGVGSIEIGRGAITTCNYEARKFGVRSGMKLSVVKKLCPDCVVVSPHMQRYKVVSSQIMELLGTYVDYENLEIRSIDEAFLDISNIASNYKTAREFGLKIKKEIEGQIGITCSVGIGPSKSVSKIASGINKPDGITIVLPEKVNEFLKDLPVKKIPGIGKKSYKRLKKEFGIETIGHLSSIKDLERLKRILGKNGIYFYNIARGIDDSKVKPRSRIKSISNQKTFVEAISKDKDIKEYLDELAKKIYKRLMMSSLEFKTVTINVPFGLKAFHSKSISLKQYSNSLEIIKKTAHKIWDENISPEVSSIRRISLKLSNLRKKSKQRTLPFYFKK
ncbi:MAG: DNA polymerase IV [Candidatus Helarchaeota archaeon]